MLLFISHRLEFIEKRDYVELDLITVLVSHIYLPLDAFDVHILHSVIIKPSHPGSHNPVILILAIHHMVFNPPDDFLGPRISQEELFSLSINVNVPTEIWTEDIWVRCTLNQVRRKLSETPYLLPLDKCGLFWFRCLLHLIQE